ncbi:MAG: menaquinone biosynthesis protein, partial [Candidatus Melainabacteria bacterium]|nr:menaquinone biosynthesis protein [Candidatus Melainabacteria bacterium]
MPETLSKTIELGQIDFINCLPVSLEQANFSHRVHHGSPSELNAMLRAGELDLAPISSFEYLSNKAQYQLLEGISISSKVQADSVLLFCEGELEQAKEIYLTNKSATSINLLKIILVKNYGLKLNAIKFISFDQPSPEMKFKLLIGDEALQQSGSCIDLGEEWHKLTGLPMVFGLWVMNINSDLINQASQISQALQASKNYALNEGLPDLIIQAYQQTGLRKEVLKQYFENIIYDFNQEHKASLELF